MNILLIVLGALLIGIFFLGAKIRKPVYLCPICKGRMANPVKTKMGWYRECPNPNCMMEKVICFTKDCPPILN